MVRRQFYIPGAGLALNREVVSILVGYEFNGLTGFTGGL